MKKRISALLEAALLAGALSGCGGGGSSSAQANTAAGGQTSAGGAGEPGAEASGDRDRDQSGSDL